MEVLLTIIIIILVAAFMPGLGRIVITLASIVILVFILAHFDVGFDFFLLFLKIIGVLLLILFFIIFLMDPEGVVNRLRLPFINHLNKEGDITVGEWMKLHVIFRQKVIRMFIKYPISSTDGTILPAHMDPITYSRGIYRILNKSSKQAPFTNFNTNSSMLQIFHVYAEKKATEKPNKKKPYAHNV